MDLTLGRDEKWLNDMKLRELNNGRVAMVAISGMVAQELVDGLNLLPADFVLGRGGPTALEELQRRCADTADEAACAKAFEAAERAGAVPTQFLGALVPAADALRALSSSEVLETVANAVERHCAGCGA